METKFKVGDKFKNQKYGKGYIAEVDDVMYLVVHDEENQRLHDGNNDKGYPKNRCWWYFEGDIKKVDFTIDDLQNGDVVTLRNGDKLVYVRDRFFEDLNDDYTNELANTQDLTDNLEYDYCAMRKREYDIIKVERPTYTTVFERDEEVKEMTIAEISKALGYEVKIVKEEER